MKKQKLRKFLALILSMVLCISLMSTIALAQAADETENETPAIRILTPVDALGNSPTEPAGETSAEAPDTAIPDESSLDNSGSTEESWKDQEEPAAEAGNPNNTTGGSNAGSAASEAPGRIPDEITDEIPNETPDILDENLKASDETTGEIVDGTAETPAEESGSDNEGNPDADGSAVPAPDESQGKSVESANPTDPTDPSEVVSIS